MKLRRTVILILSILALSLLIVYFYHGPPRIVSAAFRPERSDIRIYWKDPEGKIFNTISTLRSQIEGSGGRLIFATNGGMFDELFGPIGLYIEKGVKKKSLNTRVLSSESGNFHIQPNGVFYITKHRKAGISSTKSYPEINDVEYATQSGPMLLINGVINSAFDSSSSNYQIRNGVGITAKGEVVFAVSENEVTFYDFAAYFQKKDCVNALYLDGEVSQFYFPENSMVQDDGKLGVLIGITEKANSQR